jgi:hypothetical protein
VTSTPKPFVCPHNLDQRIDRELLRTFEQAKFALQGAFENGRLGIHLRQNDGLPAEPWQAWMVYLAGLTFGAADALVTLVMHNLGREAVILERALYEYSQKAIYYANHKAEAELEFYAGPFREIKLLNELDYDKSAARYTEAAETSDHLSQVRPDVAAHAAANEGRERGFHSMVKANHGKTAAVSDYAFYYRQQSQTPHASILGMPQVIEFNRNGNLGEVFLKFDSRLPYPNWSLFLGLQHIVNFMALMVNEYPIKPALDVAGFQARLIAIGKRLVADTESPE